MWSLLMNFLLLLPQSTKGTVRPHNGAIQACYGVVQYKAWAGQVTSICLAVRWAGQWKFGAEYFKILLSDLEHCVNRILTYLIILQKVREDVDMLLCDSSENNIVTNLFCPVRFSRQGIENEENQWILVQNGNERCLPVNKNKWIFNLLAFLHSKLSVCTVIHS